MSQELMLCEDLVKNASHRLPVCIVLDTSGSMCDLIDDMVDGKNRFYDAVREDNDARFSCEIAVVTFNSTAEVVENFSCIDEKDKIMTPETKSFTSMAQGVALGLDLLEKRKNDYKNNGVDYFQPWLLLFTDGEPTESITGIQKKVKELEANKKLTVFTFSLDDAVNIETLKGFSKRSPMRIKDGKFGEFFEWLGKSVSIVSRSNPGDKVKLDTTGIDNWALL